MSKQVFSRLLGILTGILFTLSIATPSSASHHEAEHEDTNHTKVEGVQNQAWSEADRVQGLETKRNSRYALQSQLQNGAASDESSKTLFYLLIGAIVILLLIVLGIASTLLKGLARLSGEKDALEIDYNKLNARMCIVFLFAFFGGIGYEIMIHKDYLLPVAASEQGATIDTLMWITAGITGFVFIVTHILLFAFAYKYQQREGQEALYYPKNDKLELLWTTVPAIVLTILVIFGFRTWVDTTMTNSEMEAYEIELYAYQFGWKFRYPGEDGKLGRADYTLINLSADNGTINPVGLDPKDKASLDDVLMDELVLPKGVMVRLKLRSRDVLHAAHLPHFRAQMYCVPGTPTEINLEPSYTTEQYRSKIGKPEFNFELACNQICGSSHYAMKREIKVVELDKYLTWMGEQDALFADYSEGANNQLTVK